MNRRWKPRPPRVGISGMNGRSDQQELLRHRTSRLGFTGVSAQF